MSLILPASQRNPFHIKCQLCEEKVLEVQECHDCGRRVCNGCESGADPNHFLCYNCLEIRERNKLGKRGDDGHVIYDAKGNPIDLGGE